MKDLIPTALTILGALGGFEVVKWAFTRKSNTRVAEAEAEVAETKAEREEFYLLRERLELADQQLLAKEERFHEQTQLVRSLQQQLLDKTIENGQLQSRIAALEAERSMKLCERRGCAERKPQSGY